MLRFARRPDKVFHSILDAALEFVLDHLRDEYTSDDMLPLDTCVQTIDRPRLTREVEKLREAHNSPKAFMPTEYHFLILYEVLESFIALRNDGHIGREVWHSFAGVGIAEVHWDEVLDLYFWDTDFLLSADDINALSESQKEMMGFTETTFGAANKLPPHDDELVLEECPLESLSPAPVDMFKDGEDYPYWEDVGD